MAYVKRGDLQLKDNPDKAMEDYDQAVELAPNDVTVLLARGAARRKKEWEDSEADFNKAIEMDPRSADAFRGRGLTRIQKDLDSADPRHPNCFRREPRGLRGNVAVFAPVGRANWTFNCCPTRQPWRF